MPMGNAVRPYSSFGVGGGGDGGGRRLSLLSSTPPPPPLVGPEKSVQSVYCSRVTDRKFTPELFSLLGLITPLRGGGGE